MSPQEASKLIAEKIRIAENAIKEAETIADEAGVGFSLDLGGYGMGGWYEPQPSKPDDWDASDDWEPSGSDGDYGWQASSQSC